jgi:hypothetical protein
VILPCDSGHSTHAFHITAFDHAGHEEIYTVSSSWTIVPFGGGNPLGPFKHVETSRTISQRVNPLLLVILAAARIAWFRQGPLKDLQASLSSRTRDMLDLIVQVEDLIIYRPTPFRMRYSARLKNKSTRLEGPEEDQHSKDENDDKEGAKEGDTQSRDEGWEAIAERVRHALGPGASPTQVDIAVLHALIFSRESNAGRSVRHIHWRGSSL